ncbi:hypothetical protein BC834DRAFT_897515 [Gloeopeniophorella convolvens]|nr:hypothetical protein BC834DRAFT_897515 [Gloeopeniophorella convolvens]
MMGVARAAGGGSARTCGGRCVALARACAGSCRGFYYQRRGKGRQGSRAHLLGGAVIEEVERAARRDDRGVAQRSRVDEPARVVDQVDAHERARQRQSARRVWPAHAPLDVASALPNMSWTLSLPQLALRGAASARHAFNALVTDQVFVHEPSVVCCASRARLFSDGVLTLQLECAERLSSLLNLL